MKDIHSVRITVNGRLHEVEVESRRTLADVLRHDLGYTGTHLGCEHGICGACTVLLDGLPDPRQAHDFLLGQLDDDLLGSLGVAR